MSNLMKGKRGLVMGVANENPLPGAWPKLCMSKALKWPLHIRGMLLANVLSRW